MIFVNPSRNDRALNSANTVTAQLARARTAQQSGNLAVTGDGIQNALNAMIEVVKHLQANDSIARVNVANHIPLYCWLDMPTAQRLERLSQQTGTSVQQTIIDLLNRGELPAPSIATNAAATP
ncbi:MAG: hypothetical protein U1F68_14125 [Gammaproteobacteria bacterium]